MDPTTDAQETGQETAAETAASSGRETVSDADVDTLRSQLHAKSDESARLLKELMAYKRKAQALEKSEVERQAKDAESRGEWEKLARQREDELAKLHAETRRLRVEAAAKDALRRIGADGKASPVREDAIDLALVALGIGDLVPDDSGTIPDLSERVGALRQARPFLFATAPDNGRTGVPGVGPHNPASAGSGGYTQDVVEFARERGLTPAAAQEVLQVEYATPRKEKAARKASDYFTGAG